MKESQRTEISKFLSYVLRHKPQAIGLRLDEAGWASVAELLPKMALRNQHLTLVELEEIVSTNTKQRFIFNEDHSAIRASQGHSVAVDLGLKPAVPPPVLYHGTVEKVLPAILEKGLLKIDRQQVHLSADTATATLVAQRHGRPVLLIVESGKMQEAGFPFFLSENGVWLTDAVPPPYLSLHTNP